MLVTSLRRGVDLHVVQRLLGHANLETTTRYLHLIDTDLRAAIDRAFPSTISSGVGSRYVPPRVGGWSRGDQLTLWLTDRARPG